MEVTFTTELPAKEDLYNLYEHLGWNDFLKLSSEQLLKAMEGSYYSVYAYANNSLVATGRVVSDGIMNAYLCGLGVHCQFRHKGIATKITAMLTGYCKENNLHIQFFCEEHLVPYYKKMGFDSFAIGMKVKK